MERFTIGRCRNGKIVTSHPDLDGLSTCEEIFDAVAILSVLAARWRRRKENQDLVNKLASTIEKFERMLNDDEQMDAQKEAIGAKTSIDIMNYALRLLRPEFKE